MGQSHAPEATDDVHDALTTGDPPMNQQVRRSYLESTLLEYQRMSGLVLERKEIAKVSAPVWPMPLCNPPFRTPLSTSLKPHVVANSGFKRTASD